MNDLVIDQNQIKALAARLDSGMDIAVIGVYDDGVLDYAKNIVKLSKYAEDYLYFSCYAEDYSSPQDLYSAIRQAKGVHDQFDWRRKVVIIDDIDQSSDPIGIAKKFEFLSRNYGFQFLFVIENPYLFYKMQTNLTPDSALLRSVVYKPFGRISYDWFNERGVDIGISNLPDILREADMHFGLSCKLLMDGRPNKSINTIDNTDNTSDSNDYKSELLETYIRSFMSALSTLEIIALRKFIARLSLTRVEQDIIFAYRKIGFLDNKVVKFKFCKEGLIKYSQSSLSRLEKDQSSKERSNLLESIDKSQFTKKEISILTKLAMGQNLVTKDEVADILWGRETDEKYSLWAIDKRISRLKRKLSILGAEIGIESVYGVGYRLVR